MAGGKKDKKSGKGYRIICSPMSELDSFAEISSPRVSTHASLRWRTRQRARTVGASPSRCHIVVVVVVFSLNTFLPELVKKKAATIFLGGLGDMGLEQLTTLRVLRSRGGVVCVLSVPGNDTG